MNKISSNYWNTCTTEEKEYINVRASKEDISSIKTFLNCARKHFKASYSFIGWQRIIDNSGVIYMFTGTDTKKFIKL
jgi:hypothetical protein